MPRIDWQFDIEAITACRITQTSPHVTQTKQRKLSIPAAKWVRVKTRVVKHSLSKNLMRRHGGRSMSRGQSKRMVATAREEFKTHYSAAGLQRTSIPTA